MPFMGPDACIEGSWMHGFVFNGISPSAADLADV